jgi:hypothetical protein
MLVNEKQTFLHVVLNIIECIIRNEMKILQSLLTLMVSLILLSIFWPLFVFLVIVMGVYFVLIKSRLQKSYSTNQTQYTSHPQDPNVIDVEVVSEKEEL